VEDNHATRNPAISNEEREKTVSKLSISLCLPHHDESNSELVGSLWNGVEVNTASSEK